MERAIGRTYLEDRYYCACECGRLKVVQEGVVCWRRELGLPTALRDEGVDVDRDQGPEFQDHGTTGGDNR